jgi:hypothetical protein
MLKVHFFRTPAVRNLVQDDFNHLRVGAHDPGNASIIDLDLRSNSLHESIVGPLINGRQSVSAAEPTQAALPAVADSGAGRFLARMNGFVVDDP